MQPSVADDSKAKSPISVELRNIGMIFQAQHRRTEAVMDVSLSVEEKSFVTLIGPSGCGKTTILRMVADLIAPTSGAITVLGSTTRQARLNRQVGFVFQQAALLGWRSVLLNVLLPYEIIGLSGGKSRAMELLDLVGLTGFEDYYPDELSGGMQQRVSIARALSYDPKVLLMDEPFGALDLITRDRMALELLRIWERTEKTVLFVTHSIDEAAFLSDRVLVLSARPGRVLANVPIDLPRPRTLAVRDSDEFHRLHTMLREMLM
jgi:NitT/TauT family transport system ATP-binding protein